METSEVWKVQITFIAEQIRNHLGDDDGANKRQSAKRIGKVEVGKGPLVNFSDKVLRFSPVYCERGMGNVPLVRRGAKPEDPGQVDQFQLQRRPICESVFVADLLGNGESLRLDSIISHNLTCCDNRLIWGTNLYPGGVGEGGKIARALAILTNRVLVPRKKSKTLPDYNVCERRMNARVGSPKSAKNRNSFAEKVKSEGLGRERRFEGTV